MCFQCRLHHQVAAGVPLQELTAGSMDHCRSETENRVALATGSGHLGHLPTSGRLLKIGDPQIAQPIGLIGLTLVLPIKRKRFRRVEMGHCIFVRTIHANGSSWAAPVATERVSPGLAVSAENIGGGKIQNVGVPKQGENGDIPSGNLTSCYGQWHIYSHS